MNNHKCMIQQMGVCAKFTKTLKVARAVPLPTAITLKTGIVVTVYSVLKGR